MNEHDNLRQTTNTEILQTEDKYANTMTTTATTRNETATLHTQFRL